jgi:hypothetical protein
VWGRWLFGIESFEHDVSAIAWGPVDPSKLGIIRAESRRIAGEV